VRDISGACRERGGAGEGKGEKLDERKGNIF
jgi:hypothetical protein